MNTSLIKTSENVSLSTTVLELPKYDELNNDKILKEMRAVFTGFDYDDKMKPQEVFKTAEQVESYAKNVVHDIEEADNSFKIDAVLKAAAINAKRWHFGWVISRCLGSSAYGSNLAEKLAKAANISTSYLYQYRAVGDNLSMKDAYILGLYGLGWELTRQLAALNDDDTRKALIKEYVNSITDFNNSMIREQARLAVKKVLDNLKRCPQQLDDSSNLALIEAAENFDKDAPEFIACNKQVEQLKSGLRSIGKKKRAEPFLSATADCYLPAAVYQAEEHLEAFKVNVNETLELIKEVEELLPLYKSELESLQHLELTTNEG